jgi:hypothetical protein
MPLTWAGDEHAVQGGCRRYARASKEGYCPLEAQAQRLLVAAPSCTGSLSRSCRSRFPGYNVVRFRGVEKDPTTSCAKAETT